MRRARAASTVLLLLCAFVEPAESAAQAKATQQSRRRCAAGEYKVTSGEGSCHTCSEGRYQPAAEHEPASPMPHLLCCWPPAHQYWHFVHAVLPVPVA